MKRLALSVLLLGSLGCESRPSTTARPSTTESIEMVQRAVEELDIKRVREINAHRTVIRGQCEVLAILSSRGCSVPQPEMDAVCMQYRTGDLAGEAIAVKFEKEKKP